jgi:predicted amidohydrolase
MDHSIAAIQMCSTDDVDANLEQAKKYIKEAADSGAKLIVLPENFAIMGLHPRDKVKHKETLGHGKIQDMLRHEANHLGVWVVGGTIPLAVSQSDDKVYATTLVFSATGEIVARYDKIHLFDITLQTQNEIHNESQTIHPGDNVIVFDSPLGKCGLAICYDLRFPELFRAMQEQGAEIILLPAAFTVPTGKAHWDILIRARAIENQVYMIAAGQVGTHTNQRTTYGHSMIVNPWGEVMALLENDLGVVSAGIDLDFLHQLRRNMPVLSHKKI